MSPRRARTSTWSNHSERKRIVFASRFLEFYRTNTGCIPPLTGDDSRMLFTFASVLIAATSAGVSPSPMGGNGHNVTFDGRVFIVARGDGWNAMVLRPERAVPT